MASVYLTVIVDEEHDASFEMDVWELMKNHMISYLTAKPLAVDIHGKEVVLTPESIVDIRFEE